MKLFCLVRAAAVLFVLCTGLSVAQDLGSLRALTQVANEEQLREIVAREPASGMSYRQLAEFFRDQGVAALRLGDWSARERIYRRWIKDVPDNFVPRWALFEALTGTDKRAEALELGESVLRDAVSPIDKVRLNNVLALVYLTNGNLKRTRELLGAAEKIIAADFNGENRGAGQAFWTNHAKLVFFAAQCRLSDRLAQHVKAIEQCRLADDYGSQQMAPANLIAAQRYLGGSWHVNSVLYLADAQLGAALPFDAEVTARRAMGLSKTYGTNLVSLPPFYRIGARARIEQHDYAGAESIAVEGLRLAGAAKQSPASLYPIGLKVNLLMSLVGQARWSDAQRVLDSMNRDVAGNPTAQGLANAVEPRAITAIMNRHPQTVLAPLLTSLRYREENFGPEHVMTGILRGIYGLALAASTDADAQGKALGELARAVTSITAPSSLGEEYLDLGLRQLYRRMILEKYLELSTSQSVDQQTVATTFRVADYLRGSTVQLSLSQAAARSAAGTPELADVVRRDQDATNELRGLYAFIAEQSGSAQERRVDDIVTQMRQRITELERIRGSLRTEISKKFPDYDRLVNPQPPGPEEVALRMRDGEVFVSLLPTQQFVYVWAVGKGGSAFHRAALDDASLRALVQRLRKTLDVAGSAGKAPRFDAEASHELYERLFKPVAANLQGARSIVVAPGGVLGQVPMGVLLTAPWTGIDPAQAPWLIKQAAISHVASASAWMSLNTLAKAKVANESFAAWGDPLFDKARPQQTAAATRALALTRAASSRDITEAPRAAITYSEIPALPETRLEIEAIAASLGSNAANDAYFGDRATRESVLNSSKTGQLFKKRVLVFATHGLVPGDLPNLTQPALALAANGQEQANPLAPLLTLEDVLGLKLNADWVVLSACNTASADGKAEESLSGLARGFFYAGSRSLLVTHWSVESDSAKELTTSTFAHYAANPQAPKAESLRQAMLKVMGMQQFSHPAYWAPYALVGDGGR